MTITTNQTLINEVKATVDFSLFRNRIEDIRPTSLEQKETDYNEIFALALESKTFTDDHTNTEEKFDGFAVLRNGYIVLLMNDSLFCLNHLYVNEGKLHLNTLSVAGNITAKGMTMDRAIEDYNRKFATIDHPKEIVFYHMVKYLDTNIKTTGNEK